jgi:hypothetical protein
MYLRPEKSKKIFFILLYIISINAVLIEKSYASKDTVNLYLTTQSLGINRYKDFYAEECLTPHANNIRMKTCNNKGAYFSQSYLNNKIASEKNALNISHNKKVNDLNQKLNSCQESRNKILKEVAQIPNLVISSSEFENRVQSEVDKRLKSLKIEILNEFKESYAIQVKNDEAKK